MSEPLPQDQPAPPTARRGRSLRRRLLLATGAVAGVAAVLLAADASLGAIAEDRAQCEAVGGVSIATDLATLPVTSGLATGFIGTAEASVPWEVMEEIAAPELPPGSELTLTGDAGRVVAETSTFSLPVRATLQPEISPSGTLELTMIDLTVAGRDVPPALAQAFGGTDALLPGASGGAGFDVPFDVTSVNVTEEGLDLTMQLPLAALTSSRDALECQAETT